MMKDPPKIIFEDEIKELENNEKGSSGIPKDVPKTIYVESTNNCETKDEFIKASVCVGFVSGACLKLGINVEEVILRPFFGNIDDFYLLVGFATISMLIYGLIYLFDVGGIKRGFGIFLSSFFSGYIILSSIESSSKIIVISLGLFLLLLSFHFAGVFKK